MYVVRVPLWSIVSALVLLAAACNRAPELPVYGEVPAFELAGHRGEPVTRKDLRDRVVVTNFIFTSCQTACPLLTRHMRDTQERWADRAEAEDLRFLSITVDPVRDTPEHLAEYAQGVGADARWTFLSGDEGEVRTLVVEGFKTAMGKPGTGDDESLLDIVHGERFVLLDRETRIRGFFAADEDGRAELDAAIGALLKQGR